MTMKESDLKKHPCVVLPSGDRWQVLYTGIDRSYTVKPMA
jgi:hypothetical protein